MSTLAQTVDHMADSKTPIQAMWVIPHDVSVEQTVYECMIHLLTVNPFIEFKLLDRGLYFPASNSIIVFGHLHEMHLPQMMKN